MRGPDWDAEPPTEVLRAVGAVDTDPERFPDDQPTRPTVPPQAPANRRSTWAQASPSVDPPTRVDATDDPFGRGRRQRRRRSWMVRLAGGDEEILSRAPADWPKFVSMGAVLVATSSVAAASAAFAMHMAVRLTTAPAILVGLLWGMVILNLDRMLVVSMVTTAGLRRTLLTAIPRVVLAAVIGAIISMPLVLQIFDSEIQVQRQQIQADELSAAQAALNNNVRFAAIPGLEQEETRLIGVASGETRGNIADDPEVKRLRDAVAAKEQEYTAAENALICEKGGATCGSGVPGAGPIYDELLAKLNRLRGERDDLRRQLNEATVAAQQHVDAASQQQMQVAQSQLKGVQDQLTTLRAEKQKAENDVTAAQQVNNGLLIRLQALEQLSRGSWIMLAAHTALFLLFLFVEVLPVLMKVLAAAGPASLYDRLLAKRDEDALEQADATSARRRAEEAERRRVRSAEEDERARVAQQRTTVSLALEEHRAAAQIEAGKRANERLAAVQEELAAKAITVWGDVAAARTDEELRHWYERQQAELRRTAKDAERRDGSAPGAQYHQAMSYADFVARQDAGARSRSARVDPSSRPPADQAEPGVTGSRGQVGPDGIYRPASASAGNPATVTHARADGALSSARPDDPGPAAALPAGTGREPVADADVDEARPGAALDTWNPDGWNPDAYDGDVAPPPAAPPRADR